MIETMLYASLIRIGKKDWYFYVPDIHVYKALPGGVESHVADIRQILNDLVQNNELVVKATELIRSPISTVMGLTSMLMFNKGLFPDEYRTKIIQVHVKVHNK